LVDVGGELHACLLRRLLAARLLGDFQGARGGAGGAFLVAYLLDRVRGRALVDRLRCLDRPAVSVGGNDPRFAQPDRAELLVLGRAAESAKPAGLLADRAIEQRAGATLDRLLTFAQRTSEVLVADAPRARDQPADQIARRRPAARSAHASTL
jgi:hypothetical protein